MYKTEIINVWAVHQGDDDHHSGYPAFFFSTPSEANTHAKGIGWYGSAAPITQRRAIKVSNDEIYLLDICKQPIDLDLKYEKKT